MLVTCQVVLSISTPRTFKPLIKPVIISFLSDLGPSVLNHLIEPENGALNLEKLRDELNRY